MKRKLLLIKSTYEPYLYTPLELGIVAALTPKHWDVKIIEGYSPLLHFLEADLVGLTSYTLNINLAYKLASIFKKRGIPTVLGGIHTTLRPDEALQYVDAVVIGEAESVWANVIADFESGKLKKKYEGELVDLKAFSFPRRDLFYPGYLFGMVQTSRGCPFKCDFCYLSSVKRNRYRQRPIEDVLDELGTIPQKNIYIVDDNLTGYKQKDAERAVNLFKGMIKRGIRKNWSAQVSINFGENDDVLYYAAKSGCASVCIGVEAETKDALNDLNKKQNILCLHEYNKIFRSIRQHGISVTASFMFGMDSDTPEDIRQRVSFAINSQIDAIFGGFMTPYPGTPLFEKLEKEDRLLYTNFPGDWDHYNLFEVVHRPLLMTPEHLKNAVYRNWNRLYRPSILMGKFIDTLSSTRSMSKSLLALGGNLYHAVRSYRYQMKEYVKKLSII